ncbi:MAG TPA: hypothetical protein VGA71_03565 [Actinomycetota bacterium]
MNDVAARPVRPQLRSVAGAGGVGALAGGETRTVVSPLERALERARANASDLWAARRGYTARSLQPALARACDLAPHAERRGMPQSIREITRGRRGPHAQHLVYESIEEAALALQDFLFANQNRLVRGRVLDGTAATRPLQVWKLDGDTAERGSSRRVDLDVDLGQTLQVGHGPVPL